MWVIVHHVPHDGSGGIGAALRRAGGPVVHRRPYLGEDLPPLAALRGLVVLGGPTESAADDLPHLRAERALLAGAARAGLPVLGVCFGAQLLAVALGGGVRRATRPETGIGEVELTDAGRDDPLLGPVGPRLPVLHWHAHQIVRPPGAVRLAHSADGPEQAFRWGARAWGLQFHAELDRATAAVVRPQLGDVPLTPRDVDRAAAAGARIAAAFVAAAGPAAGPGATRAAGCPGGPAG